MEPWLTEAQPLLRKPQSEGDTAYPQKGPSLRGDMACSQRAGAEGGMPCPQSEGDMAYPLKSPSLKEACPILRGPQSEGDMARPRGLWTPVQQC